MRVAPLAPWATRAFGGLGRGNPHARGDPGWAYRGRMSVTAEAAPGGSPYRPLADLPASSDRPIPAVPGYRDGMAARAITTRSTAEAAPRRNHQVSHAGDIVEQGYDGCYRALFLRQRSPRARSRQGTSPGTAVISFPAGIGLCPRPGRKQFWTV